MSWTMTALHDHLAALGDILITGQPLWSSRPFFERSVPWEREHPALSRWLRALPAEALFQMEADPLAVDAPAPWSTLRDRIRPAIALAPVPRAPLPEAPRIRKVKDRKWDQVQAFLAVAEHHAPPAPHVVEWCAGLGHLGRSLARSRGGAALLIERDPALCRPPRPDQPDPAVHVCLDIRDPAVRDVLPHDALHVALHACGTLTDVVIGHAVARGEHLIAAPCCPHRLLGAEVYAPASALARAHPFRLDKMDLRVATREATHAGQRRTRLRSRELVLRAAWDLLRREATGVDAHHGFPPLVRSRFDAPIDDFLRAMSAETGEPLPPFDADATWARAEARVREVRALELARLMFRRTLELYVILDRAVALVDGGWQVNVGTFCEAEATPRNVVIVAARDGAQA
jgi:hypothetical protein